MFDLFLEFLKIGAFAIGGGYATIPFLFHLAENYDWFNQTELTNMIAISNLTPGPVGINMATYSGFKAAGVLGSLVSTFGIILAPFLITLITIYFIDKFREKNFIKYIFNGLRPASCALLSVVLLKLCFQNLFHYRSFVIFIMLLIIYPYVKKRGSLIILIGAVLGIIFDIS